jgi:putative (di)nucleoside polyphosphate hydrolase
MDEHGYRKGVGIVIDNTKGQYFLAKRFNRNTESWQMPQGGIEGNEDPVKTMQRELYEETGIKSFKIIAQIKDWLSYEIPRNLIPVRWRGKYKGQKQQWFLVEFIGSDSEINLNRMEAPEFVEWKWGSPEEIIEKAAPFKKVLYRKIFKEFNLYPSL